MKYLKLFESFDIISHLKERGIDPDKTRVIVNTKDSNVYFFLYNLSGQLVGYQKYNPKYPKKGQNKENTMMIKYYNYISDEGKGKKVAAWGLESLNINDKYIFITEGIFDAARIHQAGYPGIAILCNDPSPSLISWINTLPQTKIVIYDNDKAGRELIKLGDFCFTVSSKKDLNDLSESESKKFLDDIISGIEK